VAYATRLYTSVSDAMSGLKAAMCGSAALTRSYRARYGDGVLTPVDLNTVGATPQTWTLICTNKGTGPGYLNAVFSVTGSVAGALTAFTINTGNYLVAGQVSFSIAQGATVFEVGDRIIFTSNTLGNIVGGSIAYDAVIAGGTVVAQIGALPGVRNGVFTLECTDEEEFTITGLEYETPSDVVITETIKAYAGRHYKTGLRNLQFNKFARLQITDQVAITTNVAQIWTLLCTAVSGATATFSVSGQFIGPVGSITTSSATGTPAAPGTPVSLNRTTTGSRVNFSLYDALQFDAAAVTSFYAVGDKFEFFVDNNGYSGGKPRSLHTAMTPVGTVITFDKFEFVLDRTSRPEIGDKFEITTSNRMPSITPVVKSLSGTFSAITASPGNPGSLISQSADPDTLEDSWTVTYVAARGVFEVVGTAAGYAGDATIGEEFEFGYGFRFTATAAAYTDGMYFTFNTIRATNDEMLVVNLYPINQEQDWVAECTAVDGSGQPTFSLTGSISGVTTAALTPLTAMPAGNPYAGSLFAHDNGIVAIQFTKADTAPGGGLRFQVGDTFSFSTDLATIEPWTCIADSDLHTSNLSTQPSFFYERANNGSGVTLGAAFTPSSTLPKQRHLILYSDGGTGAEDINVSVESFNYTPSGFTALGLRMFRGDWNRVLPVHQQSTASHRQTIPLMREASAGSPAAGPADIYTVAYDNRMMFFRYQMEKVGGSGTIQFGGAGYALPLATAAEVPFPAMVFGVDNATDWNPLTNSNAANDRAKSWGYAFRPAGSVKSGEDNTSSVTDTRANRAMLVATPWEAKWRTAIGHLHPAYILEKVTAYQTDSIGIAIYPFCELSGNDEPIKVSNTLGGGKLLRPIEIVSGGILSPEYAKGTIGVIPNCYHIGSRNVDPWTTLISSSGYTHLVVCPPGDEVGMQSAYHYAAVRLR
jgi:hypothetical protein